MPTVQSADGAVAGHVLLLVLLPPADVADHFGGDARVARPRSAERVVDKRRALLDTARSGAPRYQDTPASPTTASPTTASPTTQPDNLFTVGWLLELYELATSKVIAGRVPTDL